MNRIKNYIANNKSVILVFFYQMVYVISPLITMPYISRVLGAKGIGEYSYVYSVASYFMMFIRLGVMTHGSRSIAECREDRARMSFVFCCIYSVQLICGILFSLIYILWAINSSSPRMICLGLLPLVLSAIIDITWLLYGVEDFATTTIRYLIVKTATIFCIFFLVKSESDVYIYSFIIGVGNLMGQAVSWLRVPSFVCYRKPEYLEIKSHLKNNLLLFIPTIAVSLYKIMDKIMLGTLSTSTELGYYESSERIINVPTAFIAAFGVVMLPRMSFLYSKKNNQMTINRTIEKSIVFVIFLSTIMAFGIMSVASQFVPLFYGDGFEKCVVLYEWLLPSCIFIAIANVIKTQFLLPQKKDRQFIVSTLFGAAVNLMLNSILIPQLASVGAAAATLCSEIIVCVVQIVYSWNGIRIIKVLIMSGPFVIAGVLMYISIRDLDFHFANDIAALVIKAIVGTVIYLAVVFIIYLLPFYRRQFQMSKEL